MRIDLFLKQSRLIKRRTLAHEAAEKNLVYVNDKIVKPSFKVKINDVIKINFASKIIIVKVTNLINLRGEMMYELISETKKG